MIVSRAYRFVFFHNPKAGGTSVRASVQHFNDVGFGFWGADAGQTSGLVVDRAHIGADEFAAFYPDLWREMRGSRMFCVYRDPVARFLSSVSEHSKLFGDVDVRFVDRRRRPDVVLRTFELLSRHGTAEAAGIMQEYSLTHFRPQWIYASSADPHVEIEAFPIDRIDEFYSEIEALTQTPITAVVRNRKERLALPKPIAGLAGSSRIRRRFNALPGSAIARAALRHLYRDRQASRDGFGLTGTQEREVEDFVGQFYARDYEFFRFASPVASPAD